jgi:CBS-domain-containing membrane protein
MLDHLLNFEPEISATAEAPPSTDKTTPVQDLDAKIKTSDWLKEMGVPDTEQVVSELEKQQARQTFSALTAAAPLKEQKDLVARIETPAAVRHLTGMLTAYDWEFVHQARELRGYAVAKILEECESTNPNIRLKALGLLGKVTEVGLFTEKIEVKKTDLTEQEIDAKLKEKLAKFMDVSDAEVIDIEEKGVNSTHTPTNPDEHDIDPDNPDA